MTVEECVLNILKTAPHLSNQEVADKVRQKMNSSKITPANVSWYKSKLSKRTKSTKKNILKNEKRRGIEKYKDCYINGPKNSVLAILGPGARNIVQTLYKSKKRGMSCEFKDCKSKEKELEACHIGKERKEILEDAIEKSRTGKRYDVYRIFQIYTEQHRPKSKPIIRFLCKEHHKMLDKNKTVKDKNKFIELHLNQNP